MGNVILVAYGMGPIGGAGNITYYIETINQDFEKTIIKGKSFDEKGNYKGHWISKEVIINTDKDLIQYLYIGDSMKENFKNEGQACFIIEREEDGAKATELRGYMKDLFMTNKLASMEVKYKDGIKGKANDKEVIDLAKKW
ncbi:MAG: hypothetical protein ACLRY5_06940 [Zhenhengia sp.]